MVIVDSTDDDPGGSNYEVKQWGVKVVDNGAAEEPHDNDLDGNVPDEDPEQEQHSHVTITERESFYLGVQHECILIDSGSTVHIINSVRNLRNVTRKWDSVRTGTGNRTEIIGEG
jgi:hypothetical protein